MIKYDRMKAELSFSPNICEHVAWLCWHHLLSTYCSVIRLIISLVFFKYLILQIVQDRSFFCYEEVQNKAESDSKETVLAGILKLNTIMAYTSGTIWWRIPIQGHTHSIFVASDKSMLSGEGSFFHIFLCGEIIFRKTGSMKSEKPFK